MRSKTRAPGPARSSSEHASWFIKVGAAAALLFLHIPLWLIFLYSFTTDTSAFTFPPPGLTLKWIPLALRNPDMLDSLRLTLEVASLATLTAIVLGTLAAAAVYRGRFFGNEAISFLLVLPLPLPGIVPGFAFGPSL